MDRISLLQLTALGLWVMVGNAILVLPTTVSRHLVQSAWTAAVLFVVGVLPVAWVTASLLRCFPGQSFVGMARKVFGRPAGSVLGLVFSLWWVFPLALTGRVLAEFVSLALLDLTPRPVLLAVFGLSAAAVLWSGLLSLARLALLASPVIFGTMLIWFELGLREGDVRYLLPVGVEGLAAILRASLSPVTWGSSIAVVLLMGKHLQATRRVGRALYWAVVLVGVIGFMAETLTTLVLGFLRTTQTFPHFKTARLVGLPDFIERVDSVFAVGILLGVFIACGVLLFAVARGVSESLSVPRTYRPALGLGVVAFVVLPRVLFPTFTGLVTLLDTWLTQLIVLAVQAGLPSLVLVAAWLRGKDGRTGVSRTGPRPGRRYRLGAGQPGP
jgi:spore germination protein KB